MSTKNPWAPLVLLSLAQFMVVLDVTVANVALPSIGADLDFSPGDLQWVVTAYVLVTGGLLLLGGRIADLVDRRLVFLAGLAIFTGASLASGLAPSAGVLIAARSAQGLGAALLTPAALSIVTATYTGARRATALTTWGAIASAGAAAGMLFGGALTSWLSWEWVFLVNVPIGVAVGLGALHVIEPSSDSARVRRGSFDIPGALLAFAGLVTLVYAVQGTGAHGWGSARTLGLLAVGAALLAAFAAVERRVSRPLVEPRTWSNRPLTAGAALMLGATGLLVGAFFLNTLYLQTVLDASALETGLAFLPIALAIGVAAHGTAHLLGAIGSRGVVLAGLLLIALAAGLLAAAPDEASYAVDLLPGFVLLGLGVGLVLPAANVTALTDVDASHAGVASGLMSTAHELGAALGAALLSAIAAAAGPLLGPGFAAGYEDGFIVAAAIAAAMAVAAVAAVPSVRPARGAHVAIH
jgi:EmrB/QacA subfamily drug resistance transporter